MQHFTQKWVLVSLLKPVEIGTEFNWKDWPLHVTLAGVFAADWENAGLVQKLQSLLATQKPIQLTADAEDAWGVNKDVVVMKFQKTPAIMKLHTDITDALKDSGAVFNDPQYIGDGFIPHCTAQKHAGVQKGDVVTIGSVTLVDMFPGGDGYRRKIVRTFKFSNQRQEG